ncbi:hypothetical protein AB3N58_07075 [Leptospira sp. WS60.C2]
MHYTGLAAARFVVPLGIELEDVTSDQFFWHFL